MNKTEHIAFTILKQIRTAGFTAFFAGGSVRDRLLGREAKDYDIATNARPEQIEALFPKTVAVGKAFGVIVVVQDGTETEVATFRTDGGYQDGRRPDSIEYCGAEEDAMRRDFTINGMFYDPVDDQLIDYVGGQADLEKKIIRAIGDPDRRFAEDHLRMLRAVRFAHTLGFGIEPATRTAIQNHAPDLAKISAERIENELSRILTESLRPGDALNELVELGLMDFIIPEILPMIGQEQPPEFHPEGDVFVHTCLMLNLMNEQASRPALRGQTGVSATHVDTMLPCGADTPACSSMPAQSSTEQAFRPALRGQTGVSASHVEQTLLSVHSSVEQTLLSVHPFRPVEPSDALHTSRRRLPHWEQNSRIYFVTFRLADSIAQEKLNQWREELEIWQKQQPDPSSETTKSERSRLHHERQQEWLDKGYGACILKNPDISEIVEQTLLHFDGERYQLGDYVIMPNHVHLIAAPSKGFSLSSILKSWKGCSARKINKKTGSSGSIWMDESFDHIIRSEHFLEKFSDYVKNNPVKAHLVQGVFRSGTGSLNHDGQTGVSATHVDTMLSCGADTPACSSMPAQSSTEQAFRPALRGQTGVSASHVDTMLPRGADTPVCSSMPAQSSTEQTLLSAHSRHFKKRLAYTVLLHDIGKPDTAFMGEDRLRFHGHEHKSAQMAADILRRLKLPSKEIKQIVTAIDGHMRFKDVQKMNKSTLRKLMGSETFDLELELHRVDCTGSHGLLDNYYFLLEKSEEMKNEPILPERWITGKELVELGVAAGPNMGQLLKLAYDAQLESRFPDRTTLLSWLKTQIQQG